MATTTQLYVSFPGNAREALEFYQSVFGGDLELLTYGKQLDQGVKFPFDPPHDAVAHATLTGPFTITGGDGLERNEARLNRDDLGFTVNVETPEEGEALYARLAEDGGSAVMPFALAPWGDYFGVVEDKYGVRWNVTKQG
ncbi:VOC family protein [Corynebacterium wankanglinii]|uniref:VOC family protein n=1 Tax=Corynebacterium wankanglinii TaxID=2735136 RepID=A0A838CH76_9CORY|nr:VOC family protein [Corynebacterium wankanglinii]MBA1834325.1 VOC family protein [Corynebacterium wankanglinii]